MGGKAPLPLAGLRVLDLTLARAGPTCVRHLADWGADVIAVQQPGSTGDEALIRRDGSDFQNLHRNKRVIGLDLKTAAGHQALLRLVKRADVLVENMRPPVKRRLKIAYEDLKRLNPGLVYGSISGFGQDGPYADRAGVDQIAQGIGGLMSVTGEPGRGPMRTGIAISDMTAGNLLALGIMIALHERARTGRGQWVQTSLLESQIFMMDFQAARYLVEGEVAGQAGNDHPTAIPMGTFPTLDGHVNIAAPSSAQFARLAEVLGHPEWLDKPEWKYQKGRSRDREALNAAISAETAQRPSAYWVETLEAAGLPCGPIYSMDQVFADPQVRHLEMAAPITHPRHGPTHLVNSPLHVGEHPRALRTPAAISGVDTEAVLAEIGYSAAEIEALRREEAI